MPKVQPTKEPIEIISTYEVMPNMDLRPITATSAPKSKSIPPQRNLTKMKLLPPNQFVKIKPPVANQKSVYALHEPTTLIQTPPTYTVRTQMKPLAGSSVSTGNTINLSSAGVDGKVFTLKSSPTGTKMLSAPSSVHNTARKSIFTTTTKASMPKSNSGGGSVMIGPQTIMKSQQHPTLIKMTAATTNTVTKPSADFSVTSIFDIPIVFADNDGNIPENSNISNIITTTVQPQLPQLHASVTLPGSSTPIHMSSNPLQNRNIIINSIGPNKSNPNNKVLVFNRGTLKGQPIQMQNPMTNVTIAASSTGTSPAVIKYTKVNVSNASSINMPARNNVATIGMIRPNQIFKPSSFTVGSKVELFNNSIIKASSPIIKGSSPIIKASSPIITTLGNRVEVLKSSVIKAATSPASPATLATGKFQPIVINVDSDKTTIKNIIKVGDGQMKPNTILIKPGGLIPMMKPGILNRNLTVRKVVNIVQQKPVNTAASTSTTTTIASHTNSTVD